MQVCAQGPVRLICCPVFKTNQSPSLLMLKVLVVQVCRVLLEVLRDAWSMHFLVLEVQSPPNPNLTGSDPNFVGLLCQHCFMDVGRDFQILGDTGSFAPVCSACALLKGRQDYAVFVQSSSRLEGGRTCNSHGCSQPCACFEEEFLSLNHSIKEALPSVPSSLQLEVVKVVEATQNFCCDCVGPALKHSASGRTTINISGPKFFPLDLFEDSGHEQLPAEATPVVSSIFSSQSTRVAPAQCKSRRTRRRRQRARRHALSSDPILGLWRRVENLLSHCSQDALESAVLQLEESVPESQDECPVALALSKVALFPVCRQVHQDGLAKVLDVWIDDISADVEHFDPQIAARRAYKMYSHFKGLLPASELLLNFKKSAFTCSDPKAASALKKLLGPNDPKVCGVVKDLGVDNSGARRRRVKQRLDKASARNSKLQKLAVPTRKIAVRVNRVGVQTTATWGHQAQGLAPKRMKVIRAAAGGHAFRQSLGSLDLVFDLGEFSLQDPAERVLLEHWVTFAAFIPSLSREVFLKAWEVSWSRLHSSPHPWKAASGPMAALQCYLMDLAYDAKSFLRWKNVAQGLTPRCELDVRIDLDGSDFVQDVAFKLRHASLSSRWSRISAQEGCEFLHHGIDWTVFRELLKSHAKQPLVTTSIRMLAQGAIKRKGHGGDSLCDICGAEASLEHNLLQCPKWEDHEQPPPVTHPSLQSCPSFLLRGLVPRLLTLHPPLEEHQLATRATGIFRRKISTSKFLAGCDASGGAYRLRIVSWSVVVAVFKPREFLLRDQPSLTVLGTLSGSLQIGASVADGESEAIKQLLLHCSGDVVFCSDSSAALSRFNKGQISESIRDNAVGRWTKSHLTQDEHAERFGRENWWMWFLNAEADRLCGQRSAEAVNLLHVRDLKTIDCEAKARVTFLSRRCSHILCNAPKEKKRFATERIQKPKKPVVGPNKRQPSCELGFFRSCLEGHRGQN